MFACRGARSVHVFSPAIHTSFVAVLLFVLLFSCQISISGSSSAYADTGLIPRTVPEKPVRSELWPGLREDLVIVKFQEGSQVRLRGRNLVSLANQDLDAANALLSNRAGYSLQRLFSRPEEHLEAERLSAQHRSGKQMADLNNYYQIRLQDPGRTASETLIDALNAMPEVEIAYAEPIPEVAVWFGDSAGDGRTTPRPVLQPNRAKDTPNFRNLQGYLDSAPSGIEADTAWFYTGGRGEGVKIIDIELGWNWTHEDMRTPFFEGGVVMYSDHGIAVTGIINALDNGYGVTGIANQADIGCHSAWSIPTADAFNVVIANLDPGDIFVIELHCPGPGASGAGQDGFIALEWWQANFDAIATGTANGIICCEAAGNGSRNFDDPIYEGRYDRTVRDSGAILIGASDGDALHAAGFSNHGSRVDLSGWGSGIAATGYGDLQGGDPDVFYTGSFGGTSGATPIVTGAVAVIQGIYKAQNAGEVLTGGTIAQLLKETGTVMTSGGHIGPRPNLAQAIGAMLGGMSTITGTVTAFETGLPVANARIQLLETGSRAFTDTDGNYELTVTPGQWTLETSGFGYIADQTEVTTTPGNSTGHDVALTDLDRQSLDGIVVDQNGLPLAGALVYLAGTPLTPVTTGGDGTFQIEDIPIPFTGLIVGSIADRAPDLNEVVLPDENLVVSLRLATAESFEDGPADFSGDGEWEWGAPSYPEGMSARSGSQCWATNLAGPYTSGDMQLTTPFISIPEAGNPRLAFWHWYSIWGPFDGINVSAAGGAGFNFSPIEPIGGYTDPCIFRLGQSPNEPGWTGATGAWVPAVFDLGVYAGQALRFRFNLGFYYGGTPGWYIDDFAVHAGPDLTPAPPATSFQTYLRAPWPAPSSGPVTIACGMAKPGPVSVDVYDLAGRRIRSLADGSLPAGDHHFHWNGCNQRGEPAGQGIYFVRMQVGGQTGQNRQVLTRRITVIR